MTVIRLFPAEISVCLEVKDQETNKEIDEILDKSPSWFDSQNVPELPRDDSGEHVEIPEIENPLSTYSQDPNDNTKVHCRHHYRPRTALQLRTPSHSLVQPPVRIYTSLYEVVQLPMGCTSLSHCSQGTGICTVNKHAQSVGQ